MRLLSLPLAAVAAIALAACGEGEDTTGPPPEGPLLEYSRAGGIGFSIYSVTIERDGTGTVSAGYNPDELKETPFELPGSELAALEETLESNPLPGADDTNPSCADCFTYTLSYGGSAYTYDESSEAPEEVEAVRSAIDALPLPPDKATGGA